VLLVRAVWSVHQYFGSVESFHYFALRLKISCDTHSGYIVLYWFAVDQQNGTNRNFFVDFIDESKESSVQYIMAYVLQILLKFERNRGSTVILVTSLRSGQLRFDSRRDQEVFTSPLRPDPLWGPTQFPVQSDRRIINRR
jgi:hypothetical protein